LQRRKYRRPANGGSRGSVNVRFAPKADKWQTFRFVRFVPILLQKSKIAR